MARRARRIQGRVGAVLRRDGVPHPTAAPHLRQGASRQRGRRLLRGQVPSTRQQPSRAAVPAPRPVQGRRDRGAGQGAHGSDRRHDPGVRAGTRGAAGAARRRGRLARRARRARDAPGEPRGRAPFLDQRRVEVHEAQGDGAAARGARGGGGARSRRAPRTPTGLRVTRGCFSSARGTRRARCPRRWRRARRRPWRWSSGAPRTC